MQKRVSLAPIVLSSVLGVFGLGACSSDTGNNNNNNNNNDEYDTGCIGCRNDGQTCTFKVNCQGGSICNLTTEELYDSTKPEKTCIKVACDTTADCTDGKVCSLKKECEAPFCQVNAECQGGNICSSGKCEAAPMASAVASCEVVDKKGSIAQGATLELAAVAKNANGAVLPGIDFVWASDQAGAVAVAGAVATGGGQAGLAKLTAKVEGNEAVSCTGSVDLYNFPDLGATEARVVVVAADGKGAVSGASVYITSGGNTENANTGTEGSAVFQNVGTVDQVTVKKDGYEYVTVLSPGTKDIYIPLPPVADATKAGGFRGVVDISSTKDAEIQLGLAGPALPTNLLDFDLASLLGDTIETTINAKELGLDNQVVPLPGGVMLALGASRFTDDSGAANLRCQGQGPGANDLGCYVSRAPEGPGAAWTLAGQLKLTSVAKLAGTLSSAFTGGASLENLPIGEIMTAVLPLFQKLNHGITAGLKIQSFPKTGDCTNPSGEDFDDRCKADYSKYQKITLAADQKLSILSAVKVPDLPPVPSTGGAKYATGAIVIGGVLSSAGIIPLGLGAGLDKVEKTETPDGKVNGAKAPFGENSADLATGEVPLAMAPAHSGVEGGKVALVAIALDLDGLVGGSGIQLTGIVNFPSDGKVDGNETVSGSFLGFPEGEFAVGAGTWSPKSNPNVTATRLELGGAGKTWLVYGPGGAAITLPDFPGSPRGEILGAFQDMYVQQVRAGAQYSKVWEFGSGTNLDRAIELLEGFVIQQCSATAGAICLLK